MVAQIPYGSKGSADTPNPFEMKTMPKNKVLSHIGAAINHVYGPASIDYKPTELVVLCLVRDGQAYMRTFIEHYLGLGIRHIIFLDNGSKDRTIAIARQYPQISIFSTTLSYKEYKYQMKEYLIRRFGQNRWSLYVDIDELFDFPSSDKIRIRDLLEYLNVHSFTAVVAQMLDMFSEDTLANLPDAESTPLKDACNYYDLSDIAKEAYSDSEFCPHNFVSNQRIAHHKGGIRQTLFGADCSLTKHPLIFLDDEIKPMCESSHKIENGYIADITTVLYHFKFIDGFENLTQRAVHEENYWMDSREYKRYYEVMKRDPNLVIKQKTSRKLNSIDELVECGFLVVSKNFQNWGVIGS